MTEKNEFVGYVRKRYRGGHEKGNSRSLGYEAGPAVFGRIGFNGDMTALARANMFFKDGKSRLRQSFSFKATTF
ncbi:MAG: hypothetical protein L6V85_10445 [Clostridiales bacterium]|nr:MAG: hypothetical protein L6V85_10445 [Clostridiales bacterium]